MFTSEIKRGVLFVPFPGAVSCSMGAGREIEDAALAVDPLQDSLQAPGDSSAEVASTLILGPGFFSPLFQVQACWWEEHWLRLPATASA